MLLAARRLAPITTAIAAFVLATPGHAQAPAQTEEGAVVTVVKKFFDGMRTRDTTLMRSTVAPNAVLRSAGGLTGIGDASTVDAFIERIGAERFDGHLELDEVARHSGHARRGFGEAGYAAGSPVGAPGAAPAGLFRISGG